MIGRIGRRLGLAATSLLVLPIPLPADIKEGDLAASRWGFPVVGLGLGLALGALSHLLDRAACSPSVGALILMSAWAIATGGLHLDGLADTADGLFLGGDSERRLKVMRDPLVGSFGVVALVLVLLGKYAALANLAGPGRARAVAVASTIGRTLILVSAGLSRYARPEGTGRVVIDAAGPRGSLLAAILALGLGTLAGRSGLLAAAIAILGAVLLGRVARRRLGGITGDILGATVELGEWVILVGLGWRVAS